MLVYLAVASLLLSRVWLKFILELRLACLVEFVAVVCLHWSSRLLACGSPSPSRAIPASRPVPRYPLNFHFSSVPFSRFVARYPPDVSAPPVPFSRFVARFSPNVPVCPSGFPLRRALLVRRLFLSVPSPFCPFRASWAPFFLSFAGYDCTRRTSLLFGGSLGKPSH